jgi:YggT family protein
MDSHENRPSYLYARISRIFFTVIELLLGLRFVLKFTGAGANDWFVGIVYGLTQPLASPFLKALGVYEEQGVVLEWTTLIAMIIYWIVGWIIIKIFLTDDTVSTTESERKLR